MNRIIIIGDGFNKAHGLATGYKDFIDDYSQLIRNISRNFNDKAAMRDKIVNKEKCLPLLPCKTA